MSNDSCSIQRGVVKSITNSEVIVEIQSASACASCHAKGACGAADVSDKAIHIPLNDMDYQVGEQVEVVVKNSLGMLAVFLGYVLPLIILLITLFSLIPLYGEGVAGLAALGTVLLYYLSMTIFKNKLRKKFTFEISKLH